MSVKFVTVSDLNQRLIERGHSPRSHPYCPNIAADVWPKPDTIITVAVEPDGTLKPVYRDRYFACRWDDDGYPIARRVPTLTLPDSIARAAGQGTAECDFLTGPVRWLIHRLWQFHRVLLWPDAEYRDAGGLVRSEVLGELPRLQAKLAAIPSGGPVGALVLDLHVDADAAIFWETAALVGRSHENFYVSDEAATEVYLLHHHDKVVASVPDQDTRKFLLEELVALSDVFEDWSGYRPVVDDEDEQTDTEAGA